MFDTFVISFIERRQSVFCVVTLKSWLYCS